VTGGNLPRSNRWRPKDGCREPTILAQHFKKVIASITNNSWLHYGGVTITSLFKSLGPAYKCLDKLVNTPMPRIALCGPLSETFDKWAATTQRLTLHPPGGAWGDAQRGLWGLHSVDWKHEEASLARANDISDEEDSGEHPSDDEQWDDAEHVDFEIENAFDIEDDRQDHIFFI
jgi:hypothetical protein